MLAYRTPGAYFEWLDERPPVIQPLRTDVAGFVGIAERGPLHQPIKIESWPQFTATFGSFIPQGYLAYAVEGFLVNDGRTCWVVRAADPTTASPASLTLTDRTARPLLRLDSSSPGRWGQQISVKLLHEAGLRFSLHVRGPGRTTEFWRGLTVDTAVRVLNAGSRWLRATDVRTVTTNADLPDVLGPTSLQGGAEGLATLQSWHLTGMQPGQPERPGTAYGLEALAVIDEVSMVAIPDLMAVDHHEPPPPRPVEPNCADLDAPPPPAQTQNAKTEWPPDFSAELPRLQEALIAHCERLRDRVAILDSPFRSGDLSQMLGIRGLRSKYAALYYPWLKVSDHLRLQGLLRDVPPSGHVAGIYARGDNRVGVHKPPANERIEGARDVTDRVDDAGHAELNDAGINLIRPYAGRGIRVFGARTRSAEPEWRYVNVRRLMLMVEEAIEEQTQWIVFEPNNPDLWREVDRVVRGFLDGLWRRGMLDGARAQDAYYVRCDETTNPPFETDLGRLTCEIGLQPPWPAEFVVIRIRKTEGQIESLEFGGRDA